MKRLGLSSGLEGKTVVVQGLGNVGYHSAKFIQQAGAKIIGLSEREGAIFDKAGFDVDAVLQHRRETQSILNFPGAQNLKATEDILELDCDILIPAALENQIGMHNVSKVKAKIIGEAANGPVTSDAHEALVKRGAMIIPDTYLNAGGVTVSYFEWLKNLSHVRFGRMEKLFEEAAYSSILRAVEEMTRKTFAPDVFIKVAHGADELDLVNSGLEETMIHAYHEVREIKRQHRDQIDLRTAAFIDAIDKVATSYLELGIFP